MSYALSAHRFCSLALLVSASCGCEVDERKLQANGGAGGSANLSGSGHGGTPVAGRASTSESGGTSPLPIGGATVGGSGDAADAGGSAVMTELVDGCVDIDRNQIGDCTETLVANADFKTSIADWNAGSALALEWSEQNRAADAPSGSAAVGFTSDAIDTDGFTQSAAAQCLPVAGGTELALWANAYIEPGQGEGLAGLSAWFYEQADCGGQALNPFEVDRAETDTWLALSGTSKAPANATSMLVRLTVVKPFRSNAFQVLFDNVLVRPQ